MSSASQAEQHLVNVIPTCAALGAEIHGIDLRAIDEQEFAVIHSAWIDHLVLLFRDQTLDDDALLAFSRRFGALDQAPIQENGRRFVDGYP
jgi:taurine dioxygenase